MTPSLNDGLTREQAEMLLAESAAINPGPWEAHSRYVALGAWLIAARCPDLDPERAYDLGLLHDIGRRFGVTGMRHVLDGYTYLRQQGFHEAARICMTHSYPLQHLPYGAASWDGSEEEWQILVDYLAGIQYDDYDRLIQLCDSLALPSGFCLMEKRLVEVALRYGYQERTIERWRAFMDLKAYFERKIGGSIYRLLPGVIENTFNWEGYQ